MMRSQGAGGVIRQVMLRVLLSGLVVVAHAVPARAADELGVPEKLRVMVVAPHPDDESLAAGGLIQRVLAHHGRVQVAFMTSGDGYPEAVAMAIGHRQATASDFRGFGELRRAEALVALARYHVMPLSVTFLGFPDGGLAEIWRRGPHVPAYESPFTREDSPPPAAFDPKARYVSRDLIRQLARLIALSDPDWIVLPSPLDTHADHCATFTYVIRALESLRAEPGGPSKIPDRLLTYLVHVSGWPPGPTVAGAFPDPPVHFAPGHLVSLAITPEELAVKTAALESHRTQAAIMDPLFRSFTRPNELFEVIERDAIGTLKPGEPPCGAEPPSLRADTPPEKDGPAASAAHHASQVAAPAPAGAPGGHLQSH
jgi:LmbE family N-acetylglucosaminyl deacetylase